MSCTLLCVSFSWNHYPWMKACSSGIWMLSSKLKGEMGCPLPWICWKVMARGKSSLFSEPRCFIMFTSSSAYMVSPVRWVSMLFWSMHNLGEVLCGPYCSKAMVPVDTLPFLPSPYWPVRVVQITIQNKEELIPLWGNKLHSSCSPRWQQRTSAAAHDATFNLHLSTHWLHEPKQLIMTQNKLRRRRRLDENMQG